MLIGQSGAMALLMVPLVSVHGIECLFAATILTDVIQVVFRMLRLSRYMKFIPRSVMTGFVNALAILIFLAQVPQVVGQGSAMYALVAAGLVINVKSGGRTRLSSFMAGISLMVLVVGLGPWVARIPTGALVAVMVMVSVGTFDWSSLPRMRVMPITESIVMVATVSVVVATHDLSLGVFASVLLSAVSFARSVGKLFSIETGHSIDGRRVYVVRGELFFATVEDFVAGFDIHEDVDQVEIDLTRAHIWDASAVAAIDRIVLKLRANGARVHLTGANSASTELLDRLARFDEPGAALAAGH